jgi:hypothetical protein
MHRLSQRMPLLCALVGSVLGVSALGAQAKTSPEPTKVKAVLIKGGTVALTPTKPTVTFLTSHGIAVVPIAPATLTAGSVQMPIVGGVATTKKLNAVLLLRGAVKFATAKRSVVVRHLTFTKAGKSTVLSGTVRGKLVRLARITGLVVNVSAKSATVTGEVHLTAVTAQLIDRLVGKQVVSAGYHLGSLAATLQLA